MGTAMLDRDTSERDGSLITTPQSGRPPEPTIVPHDRPSGREWLAGGSVTAVSLLLNCWAIGLNGLGNQYYAAAARSMTKSWSNFFFASLDQGGFISVDKPPVALWFSALSARIFGVNSWSLMLPSALAGAGAVALLWITVRRRFGPLAATIAAAVLALSPINVAVDRLNLPEPFLILFLVAAAWAVLHSLDHRRPIRWLVLAGVLIGLAFNTKMLAAFIPVPAIGIALVVGTRTWRRRFGHAAVFGAVSLAVSASWPTIVDLIGASSRPFVGGSTNNTVWDLVFGYNGFGRIEGSSFGRGGFAGSMNGAGGIMGGNSGPYRLVSDALGGQIAWLLPMACFGLVAAAWVHRRDVTRRAAVLLWGGWLALYAVVFSAAGGTFHAYYTSLMTPAIAALVGIGGAAGVTLARRRPQWLLALVAAGVTTAALQLTLSGREPDFYGWTRWVLVIGLAAAVLGVGDAAWRKSGRLVMRALAVGMIALLFSPSAWAVSETSNAVLNSTLPQAGPRIGVAGSSFGSVSSNGDPTLAAWLLAHHTVETWDLVVGSAQTASGLIADQDVSVMALGGFMGTDSSTTLTHVAELVDAGRIRYFAAGATAFGRGGGGFGMRGSTSSSIMSTVTSTCAVVSGAPSAAGTIYDCAGEADALRSAG